MIIISAGMQKAGSGWYFNMINDLLVAAGYQDVRKIRAAYRLSAILKYHNCNLGRLLLPKFLLLLIPHLFGNTFLVKTHEAPTPTLRLLTTLQITRSIYIYRDPRDAAVSAFEHGKRLRELGEIHSFARFLTMEEAILAAKSWCKVWEIWDRYPSVFLLQYESLLNDPLTEMNRTAKFLGIEVSSETLSKVVLDYQLEQADDAKVDYMHLNKGVIGRYLDVMTSEQLELSRVELEPFLSRMGYQ